MKQRTSNKYAFTLVELIFVAIIIWLIMPAIFSLYNFIIKSNREISEMLGITEGYVSQIVNRKKTKISKLMAS